MASKGKNVLTQAEKDRIVNLASKGLKPQAIADKIGRSRTSVRRVLSSSDNAVTKVIKKAPRVKKLTLPAPESIEEVVAEQKPICEPCSCDCNDKCSNPHYIDMEWSEPSEQKWSCCSPSSTVNTLDFVFYVSVGIILIGAIVAMIAHFTV